MAVGVKTGKKEASSAASPRRLACVSLLTLAWRKKRSKNALSTFRTYHLPPSAITRFFSPVLRSRGKQLPCFCATPLNVCVCYATQVLLCLISRSSSASTGSLTIYDVPTSNSASASATPRPGLNTLDSEVSCCASFAHFRTFLHSKSIRSPPFHPASPQSPIGSLLSTSIIPSCFYSYGQHNLPTSDWARASRCCKTMATTPIAA